MSSPIYKINGKERRELKKKLSEMKYSHKMFWFFEDCDRVYGGGMSDEDCEKYLLNKQKEINKLETLLAEKL